MYAAYLVTNSNNPNSWRYPFALGSIAMLIVVYIRGKIKDHYKPEKLKYTKMNTEVIYSAILIITIGIFLGLMQYTHHAFLTPYLHKVGFSTKDAAAICAISPIITIMAALFAGFKKNNWSYEATKIWPAIITIQWIPTFTDANEQL